MNLRRFIGRQLIAAVVCVALLPALAPAAELPVRTVVLYKHGVGYFERSGPLAPGESARLDFNANEMNDVLKSLTVTEQGGTVSGLRYDSAVPLDQKLKEFPFRITAGQPLSAVLDQLKGARIELDFGAQKIAGAVVSGRLIPGDKDRNEHEQLTLLVDSGEMRNVDLSAASALRFTDPALQLQFKDYLAALTSSRSRDKKSVYIDSTDTKSREVKAAYMMPMPAWKSSYRLLFDSTGTQPTLEGWAIVDNTTSEDWTNVKISLVSGRPISFITELYQPKYIQREKAELAEDAALKPTVYGGAVAAAKAPPIARFNRDGSPGVLAQRMEVTAQAPTVQTETASLSTVETAGQAREVADLFEYDITKPVTVKRGESAMLPFLQQKITARKLLIYSDEELSNPLTAAELTNDAGRTLDGGPITVFDGGTYAGEALVETFKAKDKRLIGYGLDLGTRITAKIDSGEQTVREIHASRGIFTARMSSVEKKTYTINNVDARAKTLIIEQPIRPNYTLTSPTKPKETTTSTYRFEVPLAASNSTTFPVTEEYVRDESFGLSAMSPDILFTYIQNKALSAVARNQLQQIADLKQKIVDGDRERGRIDSDVTNLTNDENRNRQNIQSLSNVAGQQQIVQQYAAKLSDQETQIAKLRDRQAELARQKTALQTQLDALIAKLEF